MKIFHQENGEWYEFIGKGLYEYRSDHEIEYALNSQHQEIESLKGELSRSNLKLSAMLDKASKESGRIKKINQLSILLEAELKAIRDNGCGCTKSLKLPIEIAEPQETGE